MVCDFKTVTNMIFSQIAKSSMYYNVFINTIFASYIVDKCDCDFDGTTTSKLSKGQRSPVRKMVEYYKIKDRSVMLNDVSSIMPMLTEKESLHGSLYDLIFHDESISEKHRTAVLENYSSDYSDDTTLLNLIYEVLMVALTRKYKKNPDDNLYYAVPTGKKSSESSAVNIFANSQYIPPCKYFCGRDEELKELHDLIQNKSKVIVSGVPGIGKSELIRKYIEVYSVEYEHIGYYFYDAASGNNLRRIISEVNGDYPENERETERCYRNNLVRLSSFGRKSLLVIDSFNVAAHHDKNFMEVMRLKCDVVFISHAHFNDFCVYNVEEFREKRYCEELLQHYYPYYVYDFDLQEYVLPYDSPENPVSEPLSKERNKKYDETKRLMESIIYHTQSHPYILDFCGRQLRNGLQTPGTLCSELCEIRESHNVSIFRTQVIEQKDNSVFKGTYMDHVENLFHFDRLNKTERYVLSFMRFTNNIPEKSRTKQYTKLLLGIDSVNVIEDLIEKGFISQNADSTIKLSPFVTEYVRNKFAVIKEDLSRFIDRLFDLSKYPEIHNELEKIIDYIPYENLLLCSDDDFMCCHLRFDLYYKVNSIRGMMYAFYDMALMFCQGLPLEEQEIYWSDKNLLYSHANINTVKKHKLVRIDHLDGTRKPQFTVAQLKNINE